MRFPLAFALCAVACASLAASAQQKPAPPAKLPLAAVWDTKLDAAPAAPAVCDGPRLYLAIGASGPKGGQLVAVSTADGSIAWRQDIDEVLSLAFGANFVFAATKSAVQAFGAADGVSAWRFPLETPPTTAIASVNGWLAIGTGAEVVMLRNADGTRVWQRALASAVVAPPAVDGNSLYLGLADGHVVRLAVQDGAPVWDVVLSAPASAIVGLADRVFVGVRGRAFYALDPRNGKVRWRIRIGSDVVGVPLVDGSRLYFLSLDNLVRGIDVGNGVLHARRVLDRRALFGPFLAGKLLLVSGMTPTVEGFKLPALQPAGTFEAGGGGELGGVKLAGPILVVAGPDPLRPLVICVTGEGEIVALRQPEEAKAKEGTEKK